MAARPSLFCLIKKGRKKSSSLEALPCGHHSKKQAVFQKAIASLFVHYGASERINIVEFFTESKTLTLNPWLLKLEAGTLEP